MRKLALFTLAYFVITMALAYSWHIILFHDLYVEWGAFTRAEPILAFGMIATLIQGIIIGYLYPFFYQGGHPIVQGVKFSIIAGLLVYSVMGFATAAKFQIEPVADFLVYHTIFQLIQFVLAGIALGWIYRCGHSA